jgi:hypothetical protein
MLGWTPTVRLNEGLARLVEERAGDSAGQGYPERLAT